MFINGIKATRNYIQGNRPFLVFESATAGSHLTAKRKLAAVGSSSEEFLAEVID